MAHYIAYSYRAISIAVRNFSVAVRTDGTDAQDWSNSKNAVHCEHRFNVTRQLTSSQFSLPHDVNGQQEARDEVYENAYSHPLFRGMGL